MSGGSPAPAVGVNGRSAVTVTVTPEVGLSADRLTLVIKRRVPGGVLTTTLRRAVPFDAAAVALALADTGKAGRRMQAGQRNRTHRIETRLGVVWMHVMLGPPTWRTPRLRREPDGTVMAGWLRAAVAVKLEPVRRQIIFAGWGMNQARGLL
jgi:hypothetical protein